tara:strand:- start:123 stop:437 length:315 start_codon:yes stop_codon:yes gene_type:complete
VVVSSNRVKKLRAERGCTQQYLADICGLSLRTIQRVEKEGIAAKETLLSLCAVFEVSQDHLVVVPNNTIQEVLTSQRRQKLVLMSLSVLFGMVAGALMTSDLLG